MPQSSSHSTAHGIVQRRGNHSASNCDAAPGKFRQSTSTGERWPFSTKIVPGRPQPGPKPDEPPGGVTFLKKKRGNPGHCGDSRLARRAPTAVPARAHAGSAGPCRPVRSRSTTSFASRTSAAMSRRRWGRPLARIPQPAREAAGKQSTPGAATNIRLPPKGRWLKQPMLDSDQGVVGRQGRPFVTISQTCINFCDWG